MEKLIAKKTTQHVDFEFHVSYLDTDSGRVRLELFADQAAAERFANGQLKDEEAWAVVDVVAIRTEQQLVA